MTFAFLYWHWLALGLFFILVELAVSGFFFLWLGIAAIAVGLMALVVTAMPFAVQGLTFAVMGVVAFYLSRKYFTARLASMGTNNVSKRAAQLVGQTVVLETAIQNGRGKAFVGDSLWSVEGPDAPVGAKMRVAGVDGTVLKVVNA